MIGQRGIGKSTFLKKFPDSKQLETPETLPNKKIETFNFNCINSKQTLLKTNITIPESTENEYDSIDVEIINHDITTDTYLNTTDIGDLEFSNSASIVDVSSFRIVVLAFAMDDPNSFELIRLKWDTDLKKNIKFKYILLGLKSDIAYQGTEMPSKITSMLASSKIKTSNLKKSSTFAYKKRSCSINSDSSSSKLQFRKRHSFSETEAPSEKNILPKKIYKSFAKQISAENFIKSTCLETTPTEQSIETYTIFAQNICSIFNSIQLFSSSKSIKIDETSNSNALTSTIGNKIPKSLSAPINYFVKRKKITGIQSPKGSFEKLNNDHHNNNQSVLKASDKVPIKEKISRLFFGLGTYIVTCGSARSKKLVLANRMKNIRNARTKNDINGGQFVDNSWLLLSSHNSLNSLDEVFVPSKEL